MKFGTLSRQHANALDQSHECPFPRDPLITRTLEMCAFKGLGPAWVVGTCRKV